MLHVQNENRNLKIKLDKAEKKKIKGMNNR